VVREAQEAEISLPEALADCSAMPFAGARSADGGSGTDADGEGLGSGAKSGTCERPSRFAPHALRLPDSSQIIGALEIHFCSLKALRPSACPR
jgi:hypothetical protein